MKNNLCFIFGLTTVCDKKCILCCNNYDDIKRVSISDYNKLLNKFHEIKIFCSSKEFADKFCQPIYVMFTGGEAFLYKNSGKTLLDVINSIKDEIPHSRVVIKTGGMWGENRYLDKMFCAILSRYNFPDVEFRLGFNMYQKSGYDPVTRFVYMLEKLLPHQKYVSIDTIYDKNNLQKTCKILEAGLCELGFRLKTNMIIDLINEPNKHRRITIKSKNYKIFLDIGPSYSPNDASNIYEYYDELAGSCKVITDGPNILYYDTNLNLIHCNDSFVDASIPAIILQNKTISNELAFLELKFEKLNSYLIENNIQFQKRKDRCFFCTKYIMLN